MGHAGPRALHIVVEDQLIGDVRKNLPAACRNGHGNTFDATTAPRFPHPVSGRTQTVSAHRDVCEDR
jgi:hypothetical protein